MSALFLPFRRRFVASSATRKCTDIAIIPTYGWSFLRWLGLHFFCGAIGIIGSGVAGAANDGAFHISDWSMRPYFNQKEKSFERCSAQMKNADKITIIYSLDRHFWWTFELSSPSWNFPKGATFEVAFGSGTGSYFRQRVAAFEPQVVRVLLPDSVNSFEAFRKLPRLDLLAGGLTSSFDMTYTSSVLTELVKCVLRYGTATRRGAAVAAWVKSPIGPAAERNINSDIRKETSALAVGLIAEADIAKATQLKPNNIPTGIAADTVWKVGENLFTISVLLQNQAPQIIHLTDLIIGGDAQKCRGDFFSGAMLDVIKTVAVGRAYTNCQTQQTTTSIYYFAVPRKQGGLYLLTTIASGVEVTATNEKNAKDTDGKIRAAFMAAVAKL